MTDCDDSISTSPSSDLHKNSNLIAELVRKEIKRSINVLNTKVEDYVKKEDLQEVINQCIQEKIKSPLFIASPTNDLDPSTFRPSNHDELELSMEFANPDSDSRQLQRLTEIFTILERRLKSLESSISVLNQMKVLNNLSRKFKTARLTSHQEENIEKYLAAGENCAVVTENSIKQVVDKSTGDINPYDDLYYEWRQNRMNQLYYKKSEGTLLLNSRINDMEPNLGPLANSFPAKFVKSADTLDKSK